jgi:hypothetical protein
MLTISSRCFLVVQEADTPALLERLNQAVVGAWLHPV